MRCSLFHGGETVVAAVNYRDYILVFGSHGTVVRVWRDPVTGLHRFEKEAEL